MAPRPDGAVGPPQFGVERFTVPAVLDLRAEQFGDRVMMSIAGTPVTFAQMRDRSCAAANVLAELGVASAVTPSRCSPAHAPSGCTSGSAPRGSGR